MAEITELTLEQRRQSGLLISRLGHARADDDSLDPEECELLLADDRRPARCAQGFTFPAYRGAFASMDDGCTEAIIVDAHVQRARRELGVIPAGGRA